MAEERFKDVRCVTFDASGTLVNPHPSVGHAYADVLARHGIQAPADELDRRAQAAFKERRSRPRARTGETEEQAFWRGVVTQAMYPWCPGDKIEAVFRETYEAFSTARYWRPVTSTVQVLDALLGAGYRLAVLSNGDRRMHRVLGELDLARRFERIYLSGDLGIEKPDPRFFQHVQDDLGLSPAQLLHVGDDRRIDGDGARAAGWQALVMGVDFHGLLQLQALLT